MARALYFTDRLVLVARPDTLQTASSFTEISLIARPRGMPSREIIDDWLRNEGFDFREIIEIRHTEEIKNEVLTKCVSAAISCYAVQEELNSGKLVLVQEAPLDKLPGRGFFFVYHSDRHPPLIERFVKLAREMLPAALSTISSES